MKWLIQIFLILHCLLYHDSDCLLSYLEGFLPRPSWLSHCFDSLVKFRLSYNIDTLTLVHVDKWERTLIKRMIRQANLTGNSVISHLTKMILVLQVAKLLQIIRILFQNAIKVFLWYAGCLNKGFSLNTKLNGFLEEELSLSNHFSFVVLL